MSASDGTKYNGRPSLLNGAPTASTEAKENGSRILAALEGRVDAPSDTAPRRSKARLIALGAMLLVLGGVAALVVPHRLAVYREEAAQAVPAAPVSSAANVNSAAKTESASAPGNAPQAAIIVNVTPEPALAGSSVPASAPGHSLIADALAAGTDAASANHAVAPAGGMTKDKESKLSKKAQHAAAEKAQREDAKSHVKHEVNETHATASHAKKPSAQSSSVKAADPDADLLAMLVARTKPYKGKAAPAAAASGSASTTLAQTSKTSFADQIKACQKQGFFASEVCRWRICEGHWGKDPACPSGQQPQQAQ